MSQRTGTAIAAIAHLFRCTEAVVKALDWRLWPALGAIHFLRQGQLARVPINAQLHLIDGRRGPPATPWPASRRWPRSFTGTLPPQARACLQGAEISPTLTASPNAVRAAHQWQADLGGNRFQAQILGRGGLHVPAGCAGSARPARDAAVGQCKLCVASSGLPTQQSTVKGR
ncbi:MAG: hypothetical protein R3F18_06795 [Lysobacterales bacterium]